MEQQSARLRNTGFLTFFFSGICAISAGVVVSLLQERYGFAYGVQSEEGKGSTFWFEAKIAKQESKTVQKMESRLSLSGLEEK